MISLIVAVSNNEVIGVNDEMPWEIKSDLRYFKKMTDGKTVVMGRKTYESLLLYTPKGKEPLPGREKIILTTNNEWKAEYGKTICQSIDEQNVESFIKEHFPQNKDVVIIGGGKIFNLFADFCDVLSITKIDKHVLFNENDDVAFFKHQPKNLIISSKNYYENNTNFRFDVFIEKPISEIDRQKIYLTFSSALPIEQENKFKF